LCRYDPTGFPNENEERWRTSMIRTPRLLLRPWRDDDGDALARLLADPLVMADVGGPIESIKSDERMRSFQAAFRQFGFCKWAVEHDGAFIGYCGVMPGGPDHPLGAHHEIGWRLSPSVWGRGFATEAARIALSHTLYTIGLAKVVAYTSTDNHRSQAVIARVGMRRDTASDFSVNYEGLGNWLGMVWEANRLSTERF
jgi:RimJ/RimL family protein N-acetyltransferase